MGSASPVILVVDDEPDSLKILQLNLSARGCEIVMASDGLQAVKLFDERHFDLVLIDILLPGMDGYQVCELLRRKSEDVGIILLSAQAASHNKVRALEMGADDYLDKPFGMDELLALVRAVLGRKMEPSRGVSERIAFDGCEVDLASGRIAFAGGEEVRLTRTEHALMGLFVEKAGKTIGRSTLLTEVWGPEYVKDDHYLRQYIRRLRVKLKDNARHPHLLFTEPGVGYRFTRNVIHKTSN